MLSCTLLPLLRLGSVGVERLATHQLSVYDETLQ
jgi:hypothetical protein